MLITPGPGLLMIPAGLAILAIEFVWAKRLMERFRTRFADVKNRLSKANVKHTSLQSDDGHK